VDPLALAEFAALDHAGLDFGGRRRFHAELDPPVVQEQPAAGRHRTGQLRGSCRDAPAAPGLLANRQRQRVSGRERDRSPALECARAQLGPAEVLEHRRMAAGAASGLPHLVKPRGVLGLAAVREVQPEDVNAGAHERLDRGGAAAGGAERGDDLRRAHRHR
jgi:hypothetical protein